MYAHFRWNAVLLWDIWMNLIGTYLSMKVHHLTMIYDTILKSWEGQKIHWWLFQLYCTIFSYVLNEKLKSDSVLTPYQRIIAILVVENFSKQHSAVIKWFATSQLTIHPINFRRQSRSADKSPQKVGYSRDSYNIVWMQPGFLSIHHWHPWYMGQAKRGGPCWWDPFFSENSQFFCLPRCTIVAWHHYQFNHFQASLCKDRYAIYVRSFNVAISKILCGEPGVFGFICSRIRFTSWNPNLVSTDMLCRIYCHRVMIIYIEYDIDDMQWLIFSSAWIPKSAPQAFLSMSSFSMPCIARCRSNKTCSPSSRRINFCIICFTCGSKRVR